MNSHTVRSTKNALKSITFLDPVTFVYPHSGAINVR